VEIREEDFDELLEAHLQKPEKVEIYKPRVKANIIEGEAKFRATWSWWAFGATWLFFLYRKMYLEAGVFFLLSIIGSREPLFTPVIMILAGVSAYYFYSKKFLKDLEIAKYGERSLDDVKESLKLLGGYNTWVIWVAVVANSVLILGVVAVFFAFFHN